MSFSRICYKSGTFLRFILSCYNLCFMGGSLVEQRFIISLFAFLETKESLFFSPTDQLKNLSKTHFFPSKDSLVLLEWLKPLFLYVGWFPPHIFIVTNHELQRNLLLCYRSRRESIVLSNVPLKWLFLF